MSMYYVTIASDPSTPIQIEATHARLVDGNLELLVDGRVVACFAHWVYYTAGADTRTAPPPEPESYEELRQRARGRMPARASGEPE